VSHAAFEVGEIVYVRYNPLSLSRLDVEISEVCVDGYSFYYTVILIGYMKRFDISKPLLATYREHELMPKPALIQLAEAAE
jgi:hypothetical protein